MGARWLCTTDDHAHHVHVIPIDDLVEHDRDDDGDCVCGPELEPCPRADGTIAWLITHASADGRELSE